MTKEERYPNIRTRIAQIKPFSEDDPGFYMIHTSTYIRKQHTDGKWYLIPILRESKSRDLGDFFKQVIPLHLNEFYGSIEFEKEFGKIDPDAKHNIFQDNIYKLDTYQCSNNEYLRSVYNELNDNL